MIELTLTRYAILRGAGLPDNEINVRQLAGALDRLTNEVGPLPPLLIGVEKRHGTVTLQISRSWLAPPFGKVPLPLPSAATALSLYLFVHAIDTGPSNPRAISPDALLRRLGIATWWGQRDCQNTLDRALDTVNALLHSLDVEALHQHGQYRRVLFDQTP